MSSEMSCENPAHHHPPGWPVGGACAPAGLAELEARAQHAVAWGVVSADPEQILDLIDDARALGRVRALADRLAAVPEHRDMAARIRGELSP